MILKRHYGVFWNKEGNASNLANHLISRSVQRLQLTVKTSKISSFLHHPKLHATFLFDTSSTAIVRSRFVHQAAMFAIANIT